MADLQPSETVGDEVRAPGPAPLGLDDRVPLFRGDLMVRRGEDAGHFEVEDPLAGRCFTLYEFELTVGRMLDGRRTVADVIANGVRLGIPVDVAGLNQFVRQMWHYGFLADADPITAARLPAGRGTWPERRSWDGATRSLFQSGVRLMRLGCGEHARGLFEAVLDADPENPEAREMLALLDAGGTLVAAPLGGARPEERRSRRRVLSAAAAVVLALAAGALVAGALRDAPPLPGAHAVAR
jgi:hypothetical protein